MMGVSSFRGSWGIGLLLAALPAAGCARAPAAAGPKTVEVGVTHPITAEVADYEDFTGRLDAIKTVDIRARVSGYVTEVPFKEGDLVHVGDLLFQIDARPYQAVVDAAKARVEATTAQVAVAETNVKLAKITLDRALRAGNAATRLEVDQDNAQVQSTQANLELARANLGVAKADLINAQLNLDWTTVRSPLDGRISRRNVDPHNLIRADDTILTTIVTVDPVYTYFDVDERTYLDIVAGIGGEEGSWLSTMRFPVLMRLANEEEFTRPGTINFLDNRLNANTGTVRMRAEFPNARGFLKPGLFVRIRLPLSRPYKTIAVSDEAVLSDQGRKYVYVVTSDNKVKYRSVTVGQALPGGLRVVKQGLAESDRVIVSGMQRVRPDSVVQTKEEQPPSPPPSALGKLLSFEKK
jgi:multidrug efflux system membrane fusion protein